MVKIIADSSADIKAVEGVCFQSVPMTIRAGGRDFVDNEQLDTAAMLDFLASHNGPSGTACPGPENWMSAFEGADEIFVVCITGSLSGTWSSAMAARELYLQAHPDVKIHVFDSLSTGPEMLLLIERLAFLIREGKSFDEICAAGEEYLSSTHLLFILRSVHNLAQNGRVSKLVAGAIGILGIQILAVASEQGTIEPVEKCRGDKKARSALVQEMYERGYRGGKVRISHAQNSEAAISIERALRERFPLADIKTRLCGGLCSYYAERGGVIVGFETE